MTKQRATLAEVARRAGVSQTAASFVLSGRRREMRISADVEVRVLQAARDCDYRPNIVSRSLRTGTTHTIGFVSDTVATTQFAGYLVWGAIDAARDFDYLLFIGETEGDPELERQVLDGMFDRQVDGIILASMYTRRIEPPKALRDRPAVLLNALPAHPSRIPAVVPDETEAGRTAARVLLDAGHAGGIYLIGAAPGRMPRDSVAAIERQQGIIETLQAAGVEPAGAVGCLDWQPEQGYDATRSLLARGIRPAALICFNDRLALGAYNALAEGGLTIPTDTSVVSFDDDLIASWVTPRLTSIALPHYDLGRAAVEALLKPRAPASEEAPVYRIPMPLQERESVAPPGTERATAGKRRAKSTVRVAPGSSAGRVRR